ncbi:sugar transferase [Myroides guanonis]|uniref:Sugar transferase involved in LPS biosynthesis (Colanic, teichoic acid) n=1 Tax=Myroides guanonis TaxID=1150112 RepID=A0A1I3L4J9_9FLAO|nr:sugar transferase [Myroides guanonis]SFI79588.1 Sugar transferase involved in LPS biosynthesis (colanic, teichoic acid) [Myroides guanonis]
MYKNLFKRVLDFLAAFFGLLVLSPIFIFVTIGLFFANQGKPFFFQRRPGKNERIFSIIKFKTMNDKKGADGSLLSDADRLTPIGAFVRKTSLDEIPQLINVLKGDMSLIGPRPLLVKYLDYYRDEEKIRHTVRPGITGWAQVKGRNTLNWNDRLAYDIEYVNNISFLFDLQLIFLTVKKVFKSEDIVVDPRSIMQDLDEERTLN